MPPTIPLAGAPSSSFYVPRPLLLSTHPLRALLSSVSWIACSLVWWVGCSELSVDPLDPHSRVKRTFGENGPPVGYDLDDDAPTF